MSSSVTGFGRRVSCLLGRCGPGGLLMAVGLAVILAGPHAALGSDGIELIGVSTRAQARGGADVAVGDSALSQIDNPATLALWPAGAFRFDAAGQALIAGCHWRGPIDSADSEVWFSPLGSGAITVPVDERLTWGLALQFKSGMGSRYHIRHLLIPYMDRRVGSDMKNVSLSLSTGYKLTEKLSVGVGVRAEALTLEFGTVLGPADVEFGRGYAYGGGFQLGLHYQAREDLALGLAYRSPTWFGDLSGGETTASPFGLLPIPLGHGNIDEPRLPQRVTAGIAWETTEWLKLVGEVRWINYANSSLNTATIATDGPFDLRVPLPLGYQDQWVLAAGAEVKLDQHWTLSAGYHYATDSVSRSNLFPIGSIVAQHHLTAGLRYEKDDWWIGGGYIAAFTNSLRGSTPSRIPLGIDYGHSTIEQTQHSYIFGFGFSW